MEATFPMRRSASSYALLLLSVGVLLAISGCGNFFVSNSSLDHITLSPVSVLLVPGDTDQFSATAVNVGGDQSDITSTATWTSSTPAVATVDNAGKVTAASQLASTTITAASGSVKGTALVMVVASPLPGNLSVTSNATSGNVPVGQTAQLNAFAGSTNVNQVVSWSSSNTSAATIDANGLVTGVSGSTSQVTFTATAVTATGQISGSISLTIG